MRGTIVRPVLESRVLAGNALGDPTDRVTPVYVPPSYDEQPARRYPVIFAITGFTGTGRMLLNESFLDEDLGTRLDRLIDDGEMGEAIVVMPDCITRYGGSQYVNSAATGSYATYLAEEVVAWADRSFRTIPIREARGVFGKSSGGFGSIRMALDFPDVFSAFACHSGDMAFEYCYQPEFPQLVRYLSSQDITPRQFLDTFRSVTDRSSGFHATLDALAMASCYSPDASSELGFRLPFDWQTGEIVPDVWARWLSHDPVRMIPERIERLRRMNLIYLDCGRKDEFSLDIGARIAAKRMRDAGLDVMHEEFDAGHMNIPFRYDRSLPLLTGALAKPEG
jgi:enterochelin esterase family protein